MRRFAILLAAILMLAPGAPRAQTAAPAPPHAWLFGAWTGGIFPAPSAMTAQQCLAQPTVIFTRDLVMRFEAAPIPPANANLLGLTPPTTVGFGCSSPDELHVVRKGENEITFPDCSDFPYPLVRCPGR
jgi:hypothetical protein